MKQKTLLTGCLKCSYGISILVRWLLEREFDYFYYTRNNFESNKPYGYSDREQETPVKCALFLDFFKPVYLEKLIFNIYNRFTFSIKLTIRYKTEGGELFKFSSLDLLYETWRRF